MSAIRSCWAWAWGKRKGLRYNTVQIVSIKNTKLCLMHIGLQAAIVAYIAVWAIWIKGGYQSSGAVSGNTALKVKGTSYNTGGLPWSNPTSIPGLNPPNIEQVYDSSDLIVPSTEKDALFITTNLWVTDNQTRSTCYSGSDAWFNAQYPPANASDSCQAKCVRGTVSNEGDTQSGGVWTGGFRLKPSTNPANGTLTNCYCELATWCPDESILSPIPKAAAFKLSGVENFTVSIKQSVSFKKFDAITNNNVPKNNPVPPIYTVNQILAQAGLTYDQIQAKGATVLMEMSWDCNLDYNVDYCIPHVVFSSLGTGYNFRRVEFSRGIYSTRQLIKHYGIRLIIQLSGQGSRFDIAALLINLGAGIGLLAVSSIVADFVAVSLLGDKVQYEKAKYRHVEVKNGEMVRGTEETRQAQAALAAAAVAAALAATQAEAAAKGEGKKKSKKSRGHGALAPEDGKDSSGAASAGDVEMTDLHMNRPLPMLPPPDRPVPALAHSSSSAEASVVSPPSAGEANDSFPRVGHRGSVHVQVHLGEDEEAAEQQAQINRRVLAAKMPRRSTVTSPSDTTDSAAM